MAPDTQTTAEAPSGTSSGGRTRRLVLAIGAVLVLGTIVVFAPALLRLVDDPAGSPPVAGVDVVRISADRFNPPVIEVPAGTNVTWHFEDGDVAHNIVGDGWQSETLESGSFPHRFEQPGSYPYTCTLHLGMDGRVEVVQP